MRLKILFLAILFLIIAFASVGQVTKFKSTSYSFKFKNDYTSMWRKWAELERTEVLLAIDLTNERIKIFSKEEQVYDIVKYYDKETDLDGDITLQFQCVNQDGLKCFVRFVVLNSKNGQLQLYVDFSDMMWMYNIYKLE
jgi:hypothetical protein